MNDHVGRKPEEKSSYGKGHSSRPHKKEGRDCGCTLPSGNWCSTFEVNRMLDRAVVKLTLKILERF